MAKGTISIDQERCKSCSLCVTVCPKKVIAITTKLNGAGYHPAALLDPDGQCTGCGLCAIICPDVSITVYRQIHPVTQRLKGKLQP